MIIFPQSYSSFHQWIRVHHLFGILSTAISRIGMAWRDWFQLTASAPWFLTVICCLRYFSPAKTSSCLTILGQSQRTIEICMRHFRPRLRGLPIMSSTSSNMTFCRSFYGLLWSKSGIRWLVGARKCSRAEGCCSWFWNLLMRRPSLCVWSCFRF